MIKKIQLKDVFTFFVGLSLITLSAVLVGDESYLISLTFLTSMLIVSITGFIHIRGKRVR